MSCNRSEAAQHHNSVTFSSQTDSNSTDAKKRKKKKRKVEIETTSDGIFLGNTLSDLAKEARIRAKKLKLEEQPKDEDAQDSYNVEPSTSEDQTEAKNAEYCRLKPEDFGDWELHFGENYDDILSADHSNNDNDLRESMTVRNVTEQFCVVDAERYYSLRYPNELRLCDQISDKFDKQVHAVCKTVRASRPEVPRPPSPSFHTHCKCDAESSDDEDARSSNDEDEKEEMNSAMEKEITRKRTHPAAVAPDIAFNERNLGNDGPVCRCSKNSSQRGVRHGYFVGEGNIPKCTDDSTLYHYVLRVLPTPAIFLKNPGVINHNGESYRLEGFSLYLHKPLPERFPRAPIALFCTEYNCELLRDNDALRIGTVREMNLFHDYVFEDVMELVDEWYMPSGADSDSCPIYHVAPRYISRKIEPQVLPLAVVLAYYLHEFLTPLVFPKDDVESNQSLLFKYNDSLVVNSSKRPTALRVDGIDFYDKRRLHFLHNVNRPMCYSTNFSPEYRRVFGALNKLRRVVRHRSRVLSSEERETMSKLESQLAKLDNENTQHSKKDFITSISCAGYSRTGLRADMPQYVCLCILTMHHVRFHWSLQRLEERIGHSFNDRGLLELALTHPSFRTNYGQNADHARNALANLGIRAHRPNARDAWSKRARSKRKGLATLQTSLSRTGLKNSDSSTLNNERLEFLGDAVVEFMTTVHLYFCFPRLQEGGLATFRTALVQNRNLAQLAARLNLEHFLLFLHGPELCHEAEMKHALANTFEALFAALYLDGGIDVCDRLFGEVMFCDEEIARDRWSRMPEHELKADMPNGDRHLVQEVPVLQKLISLEESIGIKFKHIRVLAKAMTRRGMPLNDLTKGHNQRLEFLGDSVLQLMVSVFLYKTFPYFHEGNLSLLRTCLVSNNTLAIVCDDLQLSKYMITNMRRFALTELKVKDKADLVEALIGAVYVDRGWEYCRVLCRVCFLPRLKYFMKDDNWNDPKSRLQQACLTLRQKDDPCIPVYKKINESGSTNERKYQVTVSFNGERLGVGVGGTLQQAEMDAAQKALETHADRFNIHENRRRRRPRENQQPSSIQILPTVSLLSLNLPQPPFPMALNPAMLPLPTPFVPQPHTTFLPPPPLPPLLPPPSLPLLPQFPQSSKTKQR